MRPFNWIDEARRGKPAPDDVARRRIEWLARVRQYGREATEETYRCFEGAEPPRFVEIWGPGSHPDYGESPLLAGPREPAEVLRPATGRDGFWWAFWGAVALFALLLLAVLW